MSASSKEIYAPQYATISSLISATIYTVFSFFKESKKDFSDHGREKISFSIAATCFISPSLINL